MRIARSQRRALGWAPLRPPPATSRAQSWLYFLSFNPVSLHQWHNGTTTKALERQIREKLFYLLSARQVSPVHVQRGASHERRCVRAQPGHRIAHFLGSAQAANGLPCFNDGVNLLPGARDHLGVDEGRTHSVHTDFLSGQVQLQRSGGKRGVRGIRGESRG